MSELEDVVAALNSARVRYLLIGGLASVLYGVARTTTDIDFALDPKKENVRRTVAALGRLGLVPETDVVDDILAQGGVTVSNDLSVDLLTDLPTGTFGELRRRKTIRYRTVRCPTVSRKDQIRLLRATGRKKDFEDADHSESLS